MDEYVYCTRYTACDQLKTVVSRYLERAEKLKNHIAQADEKRQRQAVSANGKEGGGGGGSGKK